MKILTYNIHNWIGRDSRRDIGRLALIIHNSGADIISLNEVVHPLWYRGQIEVPLVDLAHKLSMKWVFGTSGRRIEGRDWRGTVGNGILSKYPIIDSSNHLLPRLPGTQQRSVLTAHINMIRSWRFVLYVTHLDHALEPVRMWQIRGLLSRTNRLNHPHMIVGDFNTHTPGARSLRPLTVSRLHRAGYIDAFSAIGYGRGATFPTQYPILRLDYAFVPVKWLRNLTSAEVLDNSLTRIASDHLPLMTEWTCPDS